LRKFVVFSVIVVVVIIISSLEGEETSSSASRRRSSSIPSAWAAGGPLVSEFLTMILHYQSLVATLCHDEERQGPVEPLISRSDFNKGCYK
jgi:hypothetical protein